MPHQSIVLPAGVRLLSDNEDPPDRDEPADDQEQEDPAQARAAFEASVSVLTRRGVPRQRAILSVTKRQPALHAAYLAAVNERPSAAFTAEQKQTFARAWRAAIAAELAAGHRGPAAVLAASRKHPAIAKALCGVPLK
jgi:hypothetical protein